MPITIKKYGIAESQERGCGTQMTDKLYLESGEEGFSLSCSSLNVGLGTCKCCGRRYKHFQGITRIDFRGQFGDKKDDWSCPANDLYRIENKSCPICFPSKNDMDYYLMYVGRNNYTHHHQDKGDKKSFIIEAREQGVSKAIAELPEGFKLGKSWVLLAMNGIGLETVAEDKLKGTKIKSDAIFYAYKPTRFKLLISEKQEQDEEFMLGLDDKFQDAELTVVVVPAKYAEKHKNSRQRKRPIAKKKLKENPKDKKLESFNGKGKK